MKHRNGFVTNSSSSSFILGFKSKDTIAEELLNDNCEEYFERILRDCNAADKMTLEEMLKEVEEDFEWPASCYLEWYSPKAKSMNWVERSQWARSEEFEKLVTEEVQRRMNMLKEKANGNNVFVSVSYSDHSDGELEHEIVPNLNCCLQRFNHH